VGINIIPQGSEQQGGVSFAPGSRITVRLFARGGNDRIVNATRFASLIDGGGGNDYLEGGTGNDTLSGGDNEDWVFGGWGDDALNGDAGDDHLYGGDGTDTLQGGAGSDHYRTTGYNDPWWYTTEWTYNHYDQSGGTVYTDGRTVTG
jgi:Ca2+-binding RTX toxin-like protein